MNLNSGTISDKKLQCLSSRNFSFGIGLLTQFRHAYTRCKHACVKKPLPTARQDFWIEVELPSILRTSFNWRYVPKLQPVRGLWTNDLNSLWQCPTSAELVMASHGNKRTHTWAGFFLITYTIQRQLRNDVHEEHMTAVKSNDWDGNAAHRFFLMSIGLNPAAQHSPVAWARTP